MQRKYAMLQIELKPEVGKDADIAIFNGNPMDIFTVALFTIINGKSSIGQITTVLSNDKK